MARARQPVSVAGIEFDALIDEQRQLDAEVPQYSTEEGFQISDSIIIDAETISMTLYVTDTPVTWRGRHPGRHADDVCHRLEQLYFAKEPVTITTTDAVYTEMAIQSITFQKSFDIGYSKEIPVTFRKVRKTRTRSTTYIGSEGYGSGGASGAIAGPSNTGTKAGLWESSGKSILAGGDDLSGGVVSNAIGGFARSVMSFATNS